MIPEGELREELKGLLYDEWRYRRVRPRPGHPTWEKITNRELGERQGKIQALAAVLFGSVHDLHSPLRLPNAEYPLLREALVEYGWWDADRNRPVSPDTDREEEECRGRVCRGTPDYGPFWKKEASG